MSRNPAAWYRLDESYPDLAVIRYDGDPEVWARLLAEVLADHAEMSGCELTPDDVRPPVLKWYRKNVCPPDHYMGWTWQLGTPGQQVPGPGRWQGSLVTLKDPEVQSHIERRRAELRADERELSHEEIAAEKRAEDV